MPVGCSTKIASEVLGSSSCSACGVCRKKPREDTAVVTPHVRTFCVTMGEKCEGPWMSWIGVPLQAGLMMVRVVSTLMLASGLEFAIAKFGYEAIRKVVSRAGATVKRGLGGVFGSVVGVVD